MGFKNRAETETETGLSDALLFATMCIIGLPVDVHVRDGSVYSGIFHTASVDKDYGVVLKEARLSKKGKCSANVANESVIETLVILAGDLVQVISKSVLLPADGGAGGMAGDAANAVVTNSCSSDIILREANKSTVDKNNLNKKSSTKSKNGSVNALMPTNVDKENGGVKLSVNHRESLMEFEHEKTILKREEPSSVPVNKRQTGDDYSHGEQDPDKQNVKHQRAGEVLTSSSILDSRPAAIKSFQEPQETMKMLPNGISCDSAPPHIKPENQHSGRPASVATSAPNALCSSITTGSGHMVDVASESHCSSLTASAEIVSPPGSESNKSSKEFKLNPGAKIFCPSYTNSTSGTPPTAPVATSMAYMPTNSHMGVPAAQPEVGIGSFAPRSAVPAKFLPYNNVATANGGSGSQFSQPMIGHVGSRTQPFRYAGQYHAVQAGPPAYVPPNSQSVMVGRMGQIIYVQPVPQDLVQSAATIVPVPARPLLPLHQIQFPKHQGTAAAQTLQLCVPPPFPDVQQPFAMTTHVPLVQPGIPVNRPIPVPGSNLLYSAKFP